MTHGSFTKFTRITGRPDSWHWMLPLPSSAGLFDTPPTASALLVVTGLLAVVDAPAVAAGFVAAALRSGLSYNDMTEKSLTKYIPSTKDNMPKMKRKNHLTI
jgi:hypothetical protein